MPATGYGSSPHLHRSHSHQLHTAHHHPFFHREQTVDEKKKPEMLEKIIAGKVNKRMADLCLVSQVSSGVDGCGVMMLIELYADYVRVIFVFLSFGRV